MSLYVARPIDVEAWKITEVQTKLIAGAFMVALDNGETRDISPAMSARCTPEVGHYLVRQEDGYEYLNPPEVFERKYRAWGEPNNAK